MSTPARMTPEQLIAYITVLAQQEAENNRMELAAWRQKHYSANKTDIEEQFDEILSTFKSTDRSKMIKVFFRIAKKIIKRSSMAYRNPANRTLENDAANKVYSDMLAGSDINLTVKNALRMAKLHNTVLVRPYFVDGQLRHQIYTPDICGVIEKENDYLQLAGVWYDINRPNEAGVDETVRVFWSEKAHFGVRGKSGNDTVSFNTKDANPYPVLPFTPLRLNNDEKTFWGVGADDLIMTCEAIIGMMVNLIHVIVMQGHDVAIATNLGLAEPQDEDGNTKAIEVGMNEIFTADGVLDHELPPSYEYASPSPEIEQMRVTIHWFVKMLAATHGLPEDAFADIEATVQSGVSKLYESAEMLEDREDDEDILRMFEQELYKTTAHVAKVDASLNLDPEALLTVDFAEPDIFESIDDFIKRQEYRLKFNLISVVTLKMEENPDLDEKAALAEIEANRKLNDDFLAGVEYGKALSGSLRSDDGTKKEEPGTNQND